METVSVKEHARQLCLALCELFGEGLERITLWDRIGTALATSAAKCDDGDTDRFFALCLDHIKGDPAAAARHDGFGNLVLTLAEQPDSVRQLFVRHCGGKTAIVLVHARAAWEQYKATNKKGGAA